MVTVAAVPSPQFHEYLVTLPLGKGSVVVAVHVLVVPLATDFGPAIVAVGPVLAKAPRPFGVPTPVGPS